MTYPRHLDPDEARIIDHIILPSLAAGHTISVESGGFGYDVDASTDVNAIRDHIGATDVTHLTILSDNPGDKGCLVTLVHGNSPHEVIADRTASPFAEALLAPAFLLAGMIEELENKRLVQALKFIHRPRAAETTIGE
jgi:hypothetical protein